MKRYDFFNSIFPLLLTAIIAVATCFSSYYSYKSVSIMVEQNERGSREELVRLISLIQETLVNAQELSSNSVDSGT